MATLHPVSYTHLDVYKRQNEGWVDAEVKMAEKYEGFAFEAGKQYTLQVIGNNKICITDGTTPEEEEGFEKSKDPFAYTHAASTKLFVKCKYQRPFTSIHVNIAD